MDWGQIIWATLYLGVWIAFLVGTGAFKEARKIPQRRRLPGNQQGSNQETNTAWTQTQVCFSTAGRRRAGSGSLSAARPQRFLCDVEGLCTLCPEGNHGGERSGGEYSCG